MIALQNRFAHGKCQGAVRVFFFEETTRLMTIITDWNQLTRRCESGTCSFLNNAHMSLQCACTCLTYQEYDVFQVFIIMTTTIKTKTRDNIEGGSYQSAWVECKLLSVFLLLSCVVSTSRVRVYKWMLHHHVSQTSGLIIITAIVYVPYVYIHPLLS